MAKRQTEFSSLELPKNPRKSFKIIQLQVSVEFFHRCENQAHLLQFDKPLAVGVRPLRGLPRVDR